MARLPNADKAIVKPEKLLNYLLSFEHPGGRTKAAYFKKYGYQASNWNVFELHIRELIQSQDVKQLRIFNDRTNYVVEGPLESPSGSTIQVATVWVILKGGSIPSFVTAYPGGKK